MESSIHSEIKYIISSFFIVIIFMFFYGLDASLTDLALFVSKRKMADKAMIFFFWLLVVFIMNLCRQINLKFDHVVSNQILIGVGVFLIYFFYIFAQNSRHEEITVTKEAIIYAKNNITRAAVFYWILQFITGAVMLFSIIKLIEIRKMDSE